MLIYFFKRNYVVDIIIIGNDLIAMVTTLKGFLHRIKIILKSSIFIKFGSSTFKKINFGLNTYQNYICLFTINPCLMVINSISKLKRLVSSLICLMIIIPDKNFLDAPS